MANDLQARGERISQAQQAMLQAGNAERANPIRKPEIQYAIDMLFSLAESLENTVESMEMRLEPVVRTDDAKASQTAESEDICQTKLGHRIATLYVQLNTSHKRLASLNHRIEL